MYYYEITLLYCYPKLMEIAEHFGKLVLYKALSSYSTNRTTLEQMEKIALLVEKKNKVLYLKEKIAEIFSKLSEREYKLLDYRYLRGGKNVMEGYSIRGYYRAQKHLLEKFSDQCKKRGIDEKWFIENCSGIWSLYNVYHIRKKKHEEKLITQKAEREGFDKAQVKAYVQKNCNLSAKDVTKKPESETASDKTYKKIAV